MASLNSFRQRATKLRLYLQLLLLLTTRKYANIPSYRQGPIERTWRQFTFHSVIFLRNFCQFLWDCFHFCLLSGATLGWPPWAFGPSCCFLNFSAQTIAKLMFYCNHRFSVSSSGTRRTGQPLKGMKGKASGRAGCDTLQDYCTLSMFLASCPGFTRCSKIKAPLSLGSFTVQDKAENVLGSLWILS